jgi:hypothetical protein
MDANYFQSQLWAAYRNHKETGDWFAYIGDCTQAGFRLYTTHLAERNKAYKHLPIIVSASAYPIKVAVDLCAHELYCPIVHELGVVEFLRLFAECGKKYWHRDLDTIRDLYVVRHLQVVRDLIDRLRL